MRRLLPLALVLLASGCQRVDRPDRPLPEAFFASTLLDGGAVDRAYLAGKPWVVNLWLPD